MKKVLKRGVGLLILLSIIITLLHWVYNHSSRIKDYERCNTYLSGKIINANHGSMLKFTYELNGQTIKKDR